MTMRRAVRQNVLSIYGRLGAVLLLTFFLAVALSFTACAQNEPEEAAAISSEYTVTKIECPEKVYPTTTLEKTSNGKLWVLDYAEAVEAQSLWELNDDNSWTEFVNLDDLLALEDTDIVDAFTITENNGVFCVVSRYDMSDMSHETRFYLSDPEFETYQEFNKDSAGVFTISCMH